VQRVVVACAAERGQTAEECQRLVAFCYWEAEMVSCEFGDDGETAASVSYLRLKRAYSSTN
jgi:hypothetical protein